MAVAIPYLLAAGTALSAYGQYQQGKSAQSLAQYNATLDRRNADTARLQATAEEERFRRQAARQRGEQVGKIAASGVVVNTGSPLLVLADSAREAEMDALNIRYGGELKAQGLEANARSEEFQGKNAKRQGIIGAGSTLLSGAARTYKAYKEYKDQ